MTDRDRINELTDRLNILLTRQTDLSAALEKLQQEIALFKAAPLNEETEIEEAPVIKAPVAITVFEREPVPPTPVFETPIQPIPKSTVPPVVASATKTPQSRPALEKFIGENLINKIGIAITIIGVAIGAKYSIEHQLISPLTRIILGYLMAAGLLGFGLKLKKNYESYSAVLVSGAIAIMYFITYSAYSFYGLIPQPFAFILMLIFTAFAVASAINYNKQVIAHIGLVGAYAVPFLLSEGSGKIAILFTYMAIINAGILIIAFKKYWKPLYYSSFILTWLIFFSWYAAKYDASVHFQLSLIFILIFFVIFYTIFLAYKLIKKEPYNSSDIFLLLTNSFLFYGLGYGILITNTSGEYATGLFTLCNAFIHVIVSAIIYKQKLADRNLFYLVGGLALVFLTITIPVQLDGNWVTLLWAGEAALLFWIGRTKNVLMYEQLSHPLMMLAFISIMQDWLMVYIRHAHAPSTQTFTPLLNINFFSSILFAAAFGFINYIHHNRHYGEPKKNNLTSFINFFIPAVLILVLYCAFRLEIEIYWQHLYADSFIAPGKYGINKNGDGVYNNDLPLFKTVWTINYSLLFFAVLSLINIRKIRSNFLGLINLGLNALVIAVFLAQGLYVLSELRDSYLHHTLEEYYPKSGFYITARYISYSLAVMLLVITNWYIKQEFIKANAYKIKTLYDLLLHATTLWMVSSELINLMTIMDSSQSYKLGLSILWGLYALLLIVLGIWKNKAHLRFGAIALFGVTLLKLFFYDISELNSISKTIVFVSLGVLLLIISFLYNKYKDLIVEEKAEDN